MWRRSCSEIFGTSILAHLAVQQLAERVRVDPRSVWLHEDQFVTARFDAALLLRPLDPPRLEHVDGATVEVDRASAGAGLHIGDLRLICDRHQRLTHRQPSGPEVEVTPPKSQDLTAAHPGVRRKMERRVKAVASNRVEERLKLFDVPGLDVALLPTLQGRRVGQRDDVAHHQTLALSVGHRLAQHQVDVAHRLRRETDRLVDAALLGLHPLADRLLAALGQEGRVEDVEVVRAELVQRPATERRQDVQIDVAPVRVIRAGPDPRLLDRQPPLGEVLPEVELLGGHRYAVVTTLDLLGENLLGVAAPGPRRDPGPALLASRRIDNRRTRRRSSCCPSCGCLRAWCGPFRCGFRKRRHAAFEADPRTSDGRGAADFDHTEVVPERRESIARARSQQALGHPRDRRTRPGGRAIAALRSSAGCKRGEAVPVGLAGVEQDA